MHVTFSFNLTFFKSYQTIILWMIKICTPEKVYPFLYIFATNLCENFWYRTFYAITANALSTYLPVYQIFDLKFILTF